MVPGIRSVEREAVVGGEGEVGADLFQLLGERPKRTRVSPGLRVEYTTVKPVGYVHRHGLFGEAGRPPPRRMSAAVRGSSW